MKNLGMLVLAAILGLCVSLGCVASPYDYQQIATRNTPVSVYGWTLWTGHDVLVKCRSPGMVGSWDAVPAAAILTSTTAPNEPFQSFTQAGETWYWYGGNVQFPQSCWGLVGTQWYTSLHVEDEANYNYWFFDELGLDCLYNAVLNEGEPPSVAGTNCGQDPNALFMIRALAP